MYDKFRKESYIIMNLIILFNYRYKIFNVQFQYIKSED